MTMSTTESKTLTHYKQKSTDDIYQPKTFEQAMKVATLISKSALAPKDFQNKPENTFIAMQMGAELGLSPMQAIQNIAVINGRPCLWGDSLLGVAQAHPTFEYIQENVEGSGDHMTAVCSVKRKGYPEHEFKFSVEDAKQANLWKKAGPWTQYPKRMLQMRARAFAIRNTFADALRGLQVVEEVQDYPPAYRGDVSYKQTKKEQPKTAQQRLLEAIENSKTEDELREAFKEAYHHAKFLKDGKLAKEIKAKKDAKKQELGLEDNQENKTKGDDNEAVSDQ